MGFLIFPFLSIYNEVKEAKIRDVKSFNCIKSLENCYQYLINVFKWSTGTTCPLSAIIETFTCGAAPQFVGGGGRTEKAPVTPSPFAPYLVYTYTHRPYKRTLQTKITTVTLPSYKAQPASQPHWHSTQHSLSTDLSVATTYFLPFGLFRIFKSPAVNTFARDLDETQDIESGHTNLHSNHKCDITSCTYQ